MFKRWYVKDPDGTRRVDQFESAVATVLAYLIDWSVVDENGEPIDIRDQPVDLVRSALDQLDPDDFTEIKVAVEKHAEAMNAEREEEKKRRNGPTTSNETSRSLVDAAGVTSGSSV